MLEMPCTVGWKGLAGMVNTGRGKGHDVALRGEETCVQRRHWHVP
jgi:hypothetical protein